MNSRKIVSLQKETRNIAAEQFGTPPKNVVPISQGVMTHKFVIDMESEQFVIRFYPESRSDVVFYEPDIMRRYTAAGLPTPAIVTDSRTGPSASLNYTIYRMLEGIPLSQLKNRLPPNAKADLLRKIALGIESFKRIQCAGFGELISGTAGKWATWIEFLESTFMTGADAARRHRLLNEDLLSILDSVLLDVIQSLERDDCVLHWGDIGFSNIIVQESGELVGFIDHEGAIIGGISLSLGFAHARLHAEDLYDDLMSEWISIHDSVDEFSLHAYSLLRGLRLAIYAHLPPPAGAVRQSLTEILPGLEKSIRALGNLR